MLSREIKFLIEPGTAARIREWARLHLDRDPHGEGPFGDEYRTTSLYLDTSDFDVFYRRGSFGRSKYRIRRYDGEPVAFLERKLRTSALLAKRRTSVSIDEVAKVARTLSTLNLPHHWSGSWFEQRLLMRGLGPICQIGYRRLARIGMAPSGPVRLTLDSDVRALPLHVLEFTRRDGRPILPNQAVLELKYRDTLPAVFKQLVEQFRLAPQRASKYRAAISALDLIPEVSTPASALTESGATYA
jgi:hypothetical protein